jgi:hypothetical protein
MVKWESLIDRDLTVVADFAEGFISGRDFYLSFKGRPNQARQLVRAKGVAESRNLARKALRRRGLLL